MMHQVLLERLEDERSKRVIFVSHCLLNENTRYLGGAFQRGGVDELVDGFQQEGLGIYQMPCPEQRAWGGVLKRRLLPFYGSKGTIFYRLRHVLLPLFLWYTRWVYRRIAKEVVRDIEDYVCSGFEVVGIVGVGGSPSCGVWSNLDLRCSLEAVARCPVAQGDRRLMNEEAVVACLSEGEGLFIAPDPCPCGNSLPAMHVEGRRDELLRMQASSGAWIPLLPLALGTVIEETPGVRRFQVIQTGPETLTVRLEAVTADEEDIVWKAVEARLHSYLSAQGLATVSIQRTGEPPLRDPRSGKFRHVWSELPLSHIAERKADICLPG